MVTKYKNLLYAIQKIYILGGCKMEKMMMTGTMNMMMSMEKMMCEMKCMKMMMDNMMEAEMNMNKEMVNKMEECDGMMSSTMSVMKAMKEKCC